MTDSKSSAPGFYQGLASVFRAAVLLKQDRQSWPWALVPAALLPAVAIAGIWLADYLIGFNEPGFYNWLYYLLLGAIGLFASLLLTPPLSAPALEHLVRRQETLAGSPRRSALSFFAELACGFKAQAHVLLFVVPLRLVLWGACLVFPALAIAAYPLDLMLVAASLAWATLDYPLTLWGVSSGARLKILRHHTGATLGLGVGLLALFCLPLFGILMLPVGVIAATRLLLRIAESSPQLFSEAAPDTQKHHLSC